nr:hypothetical protein [Gordonia westfalica]
MVEDERTDRGGLRLVECHGLPMSGHEVFEVRRLDGTEGAAVLESLTAEAVEVVVDGAHPIASLLKRERFAALSAEDRSFQVVVVYTRLLAALVAGLADALDLGEKCLAHKSWVATGILDPLEPDGTGVVAVLEHRGDMRVSDRSAGAVRSGHGGHAAFVELVFDHSGCPFTGGVTLEHPGDPLATLGVDDDGLHFSAVVSAGAAVEVAERCHAWGAATLRFLQHALARFGGQVAAVELGDRAHDAVEQHATRSLVDVFRAGDELGTNRRELQIDLDVVDAVACETVDLVHDDVLDLVRLDVVEHLFQFRAIGRAGAFTGIDELGDGHRIQ